MYYYCMKTTKLIKITTIVYPSIGNHIDSKSKERMPLVDLWYIHVSNQQQAYKCNDRIYNYYCVHSSLNCTGFHLIQLLDCYSYRFSLNACNYTPICHSNLMCCNCY